jgi:hypothetical protein
MVAALSPRDAVKPPRRSGEFVKPYHDIIERDTNDAPILKVWGPCAVGNCWVDRSFLRRSKQLVFGRVEQLGSRPSLDSCLEQAIS